jgi:hypothetical protein
MYTFIEQMQAGFGIDVRITRSVAKGAARGMTGDKVCDCIIVA